jgi:hypothetical protein
MSGVELQYPMEISQENFWRIISSKVFLHMRWIIMVTQLIALRD